MKLYIVFAVFLTLSNLAHAVSIEAIGGGKTVKVLRAGKEIQLSQGAQLQAGDQVMSDEASVVDIRYEDKSLVRLSKSSRYTVLAQSKSERILSELLQGAVRVLVPEQKDKNSVKMELRTPQSVVGVRGTEFFVEVAKDATDLYLLHGQVDFAKAKAPLESGIKVSTGFKSHATNAAAPSQPEAFSIPDLLKRLESKSDLFGPLAERKHGFAIAKALTPPAPKAPAVPSPKAKTAETNAATGEFITTKLPPETKTDTNTATSSSLPLSEKDRNLLYFKAAAELDLNSLERLRKAGPVDAAYADEDGNTALHAAVLAGKNSEDQELVAQYLLEHDADVNATNNDGETPLVLAVANLKDKEAKALAELFLEHNADASIADNHHETALQIAKKRKLRETEAVLAAPKKP